MSIESSTTPRTAQLQRSTNETRIEIALNIDGHGQLQIQTGLGFLDHMLQALAFHARWDLALQVEGDLHIDDHHTVEDCGLALGTAWCDALGDKRGIQRFADAYAPLDEALARCVVDISGRPYAAIDLGLCRPMIGDVAAENLTHFWQSFATAGRCTLHVDVLRGVNDHHRAEAAFKAAALALRQAVRRDSSQEIPSTKGAL